MTIPNPIPFKVQMLNLRMGGCARHVYFFVLLKSFVESEFSDWVRIETLNPPWKLLPNSDRQPQKRPFLKTLRAWIVSVDFVWIPFLCVFVF